MDLYERRHVMGSDPLTFHPSYETIDEFVSIMRPTRTPASYGPWLSIRRGLQPRGPAYTEDQLHKFSDIIGLCEAQCMLKPREKTRFREECKRKLLEKAVEWGDVCGKWVLFPFGAKVDAVWSKIAKAVYRGELGHHAKVATTSMNQRVDLYPLCVYVYDFTNKGEVGRVLRRMQELGVVKGWSGDEDPERMVASFKPDVFTRLGFYHHGTEGAAEGYRPNVRIDPVLYRLDDFL